ncbi:MAG: efflux RND transporter periplasmic adaptor subunit [Candidatus Binatia bacterium]
MKYRPWLISPVVIGSFLGAVYLMNFPAPDEAVRSVPEAETTVRVARVRRVSVPLEITVSGELRPVSQTQIVSRLAGKVAEIRVKAGDSVAAGAIVAVIHSSDLNQRIQRLEAAVAGARQDLQLREEQSVEAEKHLTKNRELLRRDLIARRDLEHIEIAAETARAQADLARAHLAQQEAMLAQIRALQELTQLSAPSSGMVSHRLVEPGALIGEGKAILTVVNVETLKLMAKVPVDEAGDLRREMKAQVSAPALPGKISKGKVTRFGPRTEGPEGLLVVEIQVENRERFFRPGMTVEARIDLAKQHDHLVIPRSAVRSENKDNYVYKIADERALRQRVVLGPKQGEEFVIVQGLKEGEAVIVDHQGTVEPGSRVRVLDESIGTQPNNDSNRDEQIESLATN